MKESLNSCTPDAQGLHVVVQGPARAQSWGRRWELCSQLSGTYGQAEPSLSAGVCTLYLMSPPPFIWIVQERPVGQKFTSICSEFVCAAFSVLVHWDRDLLRKPNSVPNAPGTYRKTILEARVTFRQKPAGF